MKLDAKFTDLAMNLLCLRLVLASPEAKAMTAPREKREEKGVVFDGGDIGSKERDLKKARRIQATV